MLTDRLHRLAFDLRYSLRQLRRDRVLTTAAIVCFALGVGVNTSIFSVVNGVLFRPLPFAAPNRLVLIGDWMPAVGGDNFGVISAPEFSDYQRLNGRVFANSGIYTDPAATGGVSIYAAGLGEPERVSALRVSPSLFPTLGVSPAIGRSFNATDDTTGGTSAIILSDAFWRRKFAGRAVVGQTLDVDGISRTIVGVMPQSFAFPLAGLGGPAADVFLPIRITADVERDRGNAYNTFFVGRLNDGVTVDQGKHAVSDLVARFPTLHPEIYTHINLVADLFPMRGQAVRDVRRPLLILLGAVGLVLLIACINVSSLLLARAAAKQREIAVRQALGASRARLVQQFFCESAALAALGGAVGLVLAVWGTKLIARNTPSEVLQGYDATMDLRVLAFTAAVVIATAILCAFVPAFAGRGSGLNAVLGDGSRGSTSGRSRATARRMLVVAQVALALMLAAGAGLMTRSFARARSISPGFTPDHVVTFRVDLPAARYSSAATLLDFDRRVLDAARALPDVDAASASLRIPLEDPMRMMFTVEGQAPPQSPIATGTLVMPSYFETMRIPLLAGRPINEGDIDGRLQVVVINEALAKHFFGPNGVREAIDHRVKWGSAHSSDPWVTIVGVTANVKDTGLDHDQEWSLYFPMLQASDVNVTRMLRSIAFVARARGDDASVARELRHSVSSIDPALAMVGPRFMTDLLGASMADRRFNTYLLGAFAALAVVLAAVGIYGLMAYTVVQQRREIGIRLALGATPRSVVSLVLGQAARLTAVGVAIGLVGALAFSRLIRSLLFQVSPFDPLALVAAALVLMAVAAIATLLPASGAATTDPQAIMRAD